jgi:hypothetical protein
MALAALPEWQQTWIAKGSHTKLGPAPAQPLRIAAMTGLTIDDDIPF